MSAAHTPGPWIVGGHPGDGSGTNWRQVVSTGTVFAPSFVCSALNDDAHLIAAALDLLEALQGLLSLIDEGWLVRDTRLDGLPDFAMRSLGPVRKLAAASVAVAKATRGTS